MIIRFNPRWLLVPALLLSLQFCRAQVDVPPTISFDLGDSTTAFDTQLWDLSGTYQLDVMVRNNGIETPLRLSFVLNQDGNGRLSTPALNNIQELDLGDNGVFAVTPRIVGKVTGSGGIARVHFTIQMHGSGTLAGQNVNSFNAILTVDAETDPTTGDLLATKASKFSAGFPDLNVQGRVPDFSTPMPQGTNATWNLSLQMAGFSRLTGTGVVTTPNRAVGLDLSGMFQNGIFKIKARGANNVPDATSGVGVTADIRLTPSFDTIRFKGKLLGQKLSFRFPED